jgi:hypothetical protein
VRVELHATGSACKYQFTISAPYMNHQYSSIHASPAPGIGHGRGRLNSRQGGPLVLEEKEPRRKSSSLPTQGRLHTMMRGPESTSNQARSAGGYARSAP